MKVGGCAAEDKNGKMTVPVEMTCVNKSSRTEQVVEAGLNLS